MLRLRIPHMGATGNFVTQWVGSKPAYSTIINTHVFNNPTPYYHGRGPMLHNAPVNEFTGLYVWVIPGISGNRLYSIEH
jgi:hypothetical protein